MVFASGTSFLLWAGYAAAIGLTASLGTYALTRRDNRVASAFGAVMVSLLVWSFGVIRKRTPGSPSELDALGDRSPTS